MCVYLQAQTAVDAGDILTYLMNYSYFDHRENPNTPSWSQMLVKKILLSVSVSAPGVHPPPIHGSNTHYCHCCFPDRPLIWLVLLYWIPGTLPPPTHTPTLYTDKHTWEYLSPYQRLIVWLYNKVYITIKYSKVIHFKNAAASPLPPPHWQLTLVMPRIRICNPGA